MNLVETIVWIFALSIAIGGAINGYPRAGATGCAAGFVGGLVLGLLVAAAAARVGNVTSRKRIAQERGANLRCNESGESP